MLTTTAYQVKPMNAVFTYIKILFSGFIHPSAISRIYTNRCKTKSVANRKIFYLKYVLIFTFPYTVFCQEMSRGTSICILRSPNDVVIAADSRTLITYKNVARVDTGVYCKIRRYADVAVTFAGFLTESSTNYDVSNISKEACRRGGTIYEKLARFETAIKQKLIAAWSAMYPAHINPNRIEPLSVAFCGMYNGIGVVLKEDFTRDDNLRIVVERDFIPHPKDMTFFGLIFIAKKEEAIQQLKTRGIRMSGDLFRTPIDFITVETETRKDVGLPIDAIHISTKGIEWMPKKPECQEED